MKTNTRPLCLALTLAGLSAARAQLTIPSDGSDGDFNPGQSVEIDLSQAITGNWNDPVPVPAAGKGIYDPAQRAIVFKYHSVTIPAGVSVTFKNHPTRSPVVWLVQQNVTIIGPGGAGNAAPAVNLNGKHGTVSPDSRNPSEPGPGGSRGAGIGTGLFGAGMGWGGGGFKVNGTHANVYGNPRLLPLIGGSGGGSGDFLGSGSGGGGAILIACSGTLSLSGKITANGGITNLNGSGGAIRLVAGAITGNGTVEAVGVAAGPPNSGRIRIETNSMSPAIVTIPSAIPETPPAAPVIWPPSNAPKTRILRVASVNAPADPIASLTDTADIGMQNNAPVEIEVETTNFPITGQVVVRATAKIGTATPPGFVLLNTTLVPGGTTARATWKVNHTFVTGFTVLQARAIVP